MNTVNCYYRLNNYKVVYELSDAILETDSDNKKAQFYELRGLFGMKKYKRYILRATEVLKTIDRSCKKEIKKILEISKNEMNLGMYGEVFLSLGFK